MANSDPVTISVRMPTSKAPPVTNFKPDDEILIPSAGALAGRKLLWDYPADATLTIEKFLLEQSVNGGEWEMKSTPPRDKREFFAGGYPQGAMVKFRIIAVKP